MLTNLVCGRNLKKGGRNLTKRTNLDALHILVPRFLVTMIITKLRSVTIKRDVYQPTAFLWMGKSTLNQTNHGRNRGY